MAFLPTGGLYITGGLLLNLLETNDPAWKMDTTKGHDGGDDDDDNDGSLSLPLPSSSSPLALFLKAYRSKGRASFLLDDIPLYTVLAKDAGLRGAAIRAEMELRTL